MSLKAKQILINKEKVSWTLRINLWIVLV